MRWGDGYIAVDWGTTNRRAFALGHDGQLQDSFADALGILSISPGGFGDAVADLRRRLGNRPMLLSGMVGSNRGWLEAPYVACPAAPADLAGAILWVEADAVGIVPGVSQIEPGADVMRGEEVQAFGALAAGLIPHDALVCHPGTHAKWIQLAASRIHAFQTMMTGELFGLIKSHGILSGQLQQDVAADASFLEGARVGLAGADLLSALFAIRARRLLGRGPDNDASYASGLLIGCDVRSGLRLHRDGPIAIIGRSDLRALYTAALIAAGRDVVEVDGAAAFLAGIHALTELL